MCEIDTIALRPRAESFERPIKQNRLVRVGDHAPFHLGFEWIDDAQRVILIADNGSPHRSKKSIKRLQGKYKNLILVHTPVHASWLNQAEIYFSIVQRKVLTPNDFPDLPTLEQQLLAFGRRYEQIATPFEWKFTRQDLDRVTHQLDQPTIQAA